MNIINNHLNKFDYTNVIESLRGISYGLGANEMRSGEYSARNSTNRFSAGIFQTLQAMHATELTNQALKTAGLRSFCSTTHSALDWTPLFLASLEATNLMPEKFQPAFAASLDHLSILYQTASVVSTISLLFFGQTFFAIPALVILGIGVLDYNEFLSQASRDCIHCYSTSLSMITGFIFGNRFDQVFMIFNALSSYTNWSPQVALIENQPPPEITYENAQAFLAARYERLFINKNYIYYPFAPCDDSTPRSFRDEVLAHFQSERKLWINENLLTIAPALNPYIQDCYAEFFGLPKENSVSIPTPPFIQWINHLSRATYLNDFWYDHTMHKAITKLQNWINSADNSKHLFDDFWKTWLNTQNISGETRASFLEQLKSPAKSGGKVSYQGAQLTLFALGILQFSEQN